MLFSAEAIAARVGGLAAEIAGSMAPDILLVIILKGSFMFAADLLRALHAVGMRPQVDFLSLSSYGEEMMSSGSVKIVRDVSDSIEGRQVLLLDDILETGRTIAFARNLLVGRGAREVKLCVLLDKKRSRLVEADFTGFPCPDQFVVGYGLDRAHYFRELPYVGTPPE